MKNKTPFLRRKIFIKKKFQTDFSIKFLILIAVESVLAIGLFSYLSRGTVITGYSGSELIIAKTGDYFLPTLLLANLVVIGFTAAAGFVVMLLASHKIAGPLYRFEKSLEELGKGDLTHRFSLRSDDQLNELAEKMNELSTRLDGSVTSIQKGVSELKEAFGAIQSSVASGSYSTATLDAQIKEALSRVAELERSADYFKTSGGRRK